MDRRLFSNRVLSLLLAAMITFTLLSARSLAETDYDMPYYIVVDLNNQIVTVYDTQTRQVERQMLCSSGRNNTTPTGNYIMPRSKRAYDRQPWYYISMFHRYVRYASRIMGEILFHSLPYTGKSIRSVDAQAASELGFATSHGCIRLRWQDAEFIANNCLPGTLVQIIEGSEKDDGLRELLFQQSYDASMGLSYDQFLGISEEEGALGRFSEGKDVLDLQYRMRDLGLYDGELSGSYDSATVNAVRMAQYLMDEPIDGVATTHFREQIFSQNAPIAMEVSLAQGMSGPAVRSLQDHLATLRLYTDEPDNVFDDAVVRAVTQFQQVYGYAQDGIATPKVQKAIVYEAERLTQTFAAEPYAMEWLSYPLLLAQVKVKEGAKLRSMASQRSEPIRRLSKGQTLPVLQRGENWSKVRAGADEGYVKSDLLAFAEQQIPVLQYRGTDTDRVLIVGIDAENIDQGIRYPSERFDEYLAANDQQVDLDALVSYVTIDTGDDSVCLNLRQSPQEDSPVLSALPNGTRIRVQRRLGQWTQVHYQGKTGYLLNRYLNFRTGLVDAQDEETDGQEEPANVTPGIVKSTSGKKAEVFDAHFDDAEVLGSLPDGTSVDVLDAWDGWCRIRWQGREGYMLAEDLQAAPSSGD